jgi:hypothetical protein
MLRRRKRLITRETSWRWKEAVKGVGMWMSECATDCVVFLAGSRSCTKQRYVASLFVRAYVLIVYVVVYS